MDNDQRAFLTETETTGRADFHSDILFFYFGFEFFFYFDTAVTATSGTGADRHQFFLRIVVFFELFLNLAQGLGVSNFYHDCCAPSFILPIILSTLAMVTCP